MGDRHRWQFFRSGGVDQVLIRNGQDIARLKELDLKLWMALSMPVRGSSLDAETLALMDSDGDGRIRPGELLDAVDWAAARLRSLDILMEPGDALPLDEITDPALRSAAKLILAGAGKVGVYVIGLADIQGCETGLDALSFNGDGILLPSAIEDPVIKAAIVDMIEGSGGVEDACGDLGLDRAALARFLDGAGAYLAWLEAGRAPGLVPALPRPDEGWAAYLALRDKIDDFFTRRAASSYDPSAAAALRPASDDWRRIGKATLGPRSEELEALPLALAEGDELPLATGINPAWADRLMRFQELVADPLLGDGVASLDEAAWRAVRDAMEPYGAWLDAEPAFAGKALGEERLRDLLGASYRREIEGFIARDEALAAERASVRAVERLVRYRKDLYEIITNYVNFADFYGRTTAAFQAGTLYLDARACSLCIEVNDEARHAAMAAQSGAFLAYCDLSRPGGCRKKIVAAVTDGDPDTVTVGRNGLFIDTKGLDWDASVTKVIPNPISVREAFWTPYKRLVRLVEEQIAKKAQTGDEAAAAVLSQATGVLSDADKKAQAAKAGAKRFDLGAIALVGTAVGGVSALVGGFLQALFGLGIFFPLGVAGLLALISGPSMVLASLKLRKRNLGPILDANGWAVNTRARINLAFGASLTERASLPPGSLPSLADPFADKRRRLPIYLLILAAAALAGYLAWRSGTLDGALPEAWRRGEPDAAAAPSAPAAGPTAEPAIGGQVPATPASP
mgnify:CR=1 FL=1